MAISVKKALAKYGSPAIDAAYLDMKISQFEAMPASQQSKYSGFVTPEGTIHVDHPLTDFSLKYQNAELIGDLVMPRIPVVKDTDIYFAYGREEFALNNDVRANGAKGNEVRSLSVTTELPYRCLTHQLQDYFTEIDVQNADQPLNIELDKTENLTKMLGINREYRVSTLYSSVSNWSTVDPTNSAHIGGVTLSGAQQMNNAAYDNSTPTGNIEYLIDNGKQAILNAIGRDPNVIIIPRTVARVIKRDSYVRNLLRYTDATLVENGELPERLWNMDVFEPAAIYASNEAGQTFSSAGLWGNNIILLYLAENPRQIKTMTAGLTFMAQPRIVNKWHDFSIRGDQIECLERIVEKQISAYCGYVIADVIG